MLFDLRSRRRRHTVRVIYLILALLMLSGLVLVGVGTGNNNGGLLNAFTNNGSGSSQNPAQGQVNAALKAIHKHPSSASAWAGMVLARWSAAGSGSDFNTASGTFTSAGRSELNQAAAAWQRYVTLAGGKPALETARLATSIYRALTRWSDASEAWQYVIQATGPAGALQGDVCTALTSYAAKNKANGNLAAAAAIKAAPKIDKLQLKTMFGASKVSASSAAQNAATDC